MTNDHSAIPLKLTEHVKSAGCAAKISSADLQAVLANLSKPICPQLLAGLDNWEDAAVYKITQDVAIVQTIDFFPPMVDDPVLFGRIAATNALSDLYAMGAKPILALNLLCFPVCDFPLSVAGQILQGGASQVEAAGAVVAGGHSIQSAEVIYGLAVTGLIKPEAILTNSGAQVGDNLILTKPIGTGIGLLGHKGEILTLQASQALFSNLTTLSEKALACASSFPIHAATDVTGFGLIGHLHEMAAGANLKFSLKARQVPLLPQVLELASQGFVPAAAYANRQSFADFATVDKNLEQAMVDLLFDPQTSGGLLLAVAPKDCQPLLNSLQATGIGASCIGEFSSGAKGIIEVLA